MAKINTSRLITSLEKATAIKVADKRSAEKAARRAANLERANGYIELAKGDMQKYIAIVRSQIGRNKQPFFTFRNVNHHNRSGDIDCGFLMAEYIRQEREDGVPESITDDKILKLWEDGVSLGRVLSCDMVKLSNFYQGKGKQGAKPYVCLEHMVTALGVVANEHSDLEEAIYNALHLISVGVKVNPAEDMFTSLNRKAPGVEKVLNKILAD